jgi:hypothetical protein
VKAVASAESLTSKASQLPECLARHAEVAADLATIAQAEGELRVIATAAQEEAHRIAEYQRKLRLIEEKRKLAEERSRYATPLEALEAEFQTIGEKRTQAQTRLTHANGKVSTSSYRPRRADSPSYAYTETRSRPWSKSALN